MPKRIEDLEKDNRPTIFDQFKDLPPREFVKKAIVVFWYGMTGKDLPAEDKNKKPQSRQ